MRTTLFSLIIFLITCFTPTVTFLHVAHAKTLWNYNGDENGEINWGNISKVFALCENGKNQSPIEISYTTVQPLPALNFEYRPGKATLQFISYAIHITPDNANSVVEAGRRFNLKSIEFHTPGEHIVANTFYPLELHFVHENANHEKLIVAVFGRIGAPNAALETVSMKASNNPASKAEIELSPLQLIPEKRGYFSYLGSLTYPPCSERVEWRILKQPITLSKEQFSKISAIIGRNARMTQPVYLRTIWESAE